MKFATSHQNPVRATLDTSVTKVQTLLDEARDRNPGLRLLAVDQELQNVLNFVPEAIGAVEANAHNFQLLSYLTGWLLERDALSVSRSEETDGLMAPALNIIDSIEALIAAAKRPPQV